MPQSGVAVPRDGRSHHEQRPAARSTEPSRAPRATTEAGRAPRSAAGPAAPARWDAPAERRTVTIRGRGSERYVEPRSSSARRRPQRRYERSGFRPDRTAMWAVLLGLMLILAAAASAHAATLHAVAHLHY